MRLLQALALAMMVLGTNASAATPEGPEGQIYFTGSKLLELCAAENRARLDLQSAYDFGLCLGFVIGINDSAQCGDPTWGFSIKLPLGVTSGQAAKIVTKYLNDHPEELHLAAASLVASALQTAFPCP